MSNTLPGSILPVAYQVDEFGQEAPNGCGAAAQPYWEKNSSSPSRLTP